MLRPVLNIIFEGYGTGKGLVFTPGIHHNHPAGSVPGHGQCFFSRSFNFHIVKEYDRFAVVNNVSDFSTGKPEIYGAVDSTNLLWSQIEKNKFRAVKQLVHDHIVFTHSVSQ